MHLTWRSFVAAMVYGSGSASIVLTAVSANGAVTKLEWLAVLASFVFAAAGSFTRTTTPSNKTSDQTTT